MKEGRLRGGKNGKRGRGSKRRERRGRGPLALEKDRTLTKQIVIAIVSFRDTHILAMEVRLLRHLVTPSVQRTLHPFCLTRCMEVFSRGVGRVGQRVDMGIIRVRGRGEPRLPLVPHMDMGILVEGRGVGRRLFLDMGMRGVGVVGWCTSLDMDMLRGRRSNLLIVSRHRFIVGSRRRGKRRGRGRGEKRRGGRGSREK